jgi:hypothetical protein
MKGIIAKVSTWAIFLGALLGGYGLHDIYNERDVGTEARVIELDALQKESGGLTFASVTGGRLAFMNMYEYSVSTKKSKAKLSTQYFIPVLDQNDNIVYVVETAVEPTLRAIADVASYSGLLQSKDGLPEKLRTAFDVDFSSSNYMYLDTTYKPETLVEKLLGLKIFFMMFFGGIFVQLLLKKKPAANGEDASLQGSDSNGGAVEGSVPAGAGAEAAVPEESSVVKGKAEGASE